MAGETKTITFAARQTGIPGCGVVNLKFLAGDLRSEYVSGSEVDNGDTTWSYDFWVQEEDLPGSMVMDDVQTANVIAPLWSCKADDDAVIEDETCEARVGGCFDGLSVLEELTENDFVGIFRFNPECETYCLFVMTPEDFKVALELLP